jgi:hypothetical protein
MASLSNINGLFDVHSTGAILFSNTHGTSGQILRSNGNAAPTWVAVSTVIGGPYLPLTGGTLTGNLAINGTNTLTVGGNITANDGLFIYGTSYWVVSSSDAALQRVDARDDATNFSRLHWYGENDAGATSNFRHAYYDGASYIDVTASAGIITYTGGATFTGLVSGITPTAAANFATKAYVDAQPQGDLTSITLGNGLTGSSLTGPIPDILMSGSYTGTFTATSLASNSFLNNAGSLLFSAGQTTGTTRSLNLRTISPTNDPSSVDQSDATGITWGQRTDSNPYYIIYPKKENWNSSGDYSKLTIAWHTGIRIGANDAYGGTRFYDDSPDISGAAVILNVGVGNADVGVVNGLTIGGSTQGRLSAGNVDRNLKYTGGSGGTDGGFTGFSNTGANLWQLYGSGNSYGFLNSEWGQWDLEKAKGSNLYMNNNTTYYLNTTSNSNFAGSLNIGSNLLVTGSAYQPASGGGYIGKPYGGDFYTTQNVYTGAIQVTLPTGGTGLDDMLKFVIDIFDYATQESVTVFVGGYTYQNVGSGNTTWYNVQAQVIGQSSAQNYTVRFGDNGTSHCVWVGDTNSSWNHLQVIVRDFFVGYGANINNWTGAWDISVVTTQTTVNNTLTNNFPMSSGDIGGPYLPLTGGTLSGDLTINGTLNVSDQGRFKSWYTSGSGLALEVGISAGNGYVLTYNRDTNAYGSTIIESTGIQFAAHSSGKFYFTGGNVGIGTTGPFSKLQVGNATFSGGNGMYADSRVGISNHGSLTGLMLASTYNDATHPEYGLVFVQGPDTSNYNVWSISPDGPARGSGLSFNYQYNATNVHPPSNTKVYFEGSTGYVGIGTTSPSEILHLNAPGTGCFIRFQNTGGSGVYIGGRSETMEMYTNGSEKMRITSGGNVGIQNTNPGALLDVGTTIHPNTTGIDVTGVNCIGLNTVDNHNWLPYTDGNNYYSASNHTFRGGTNNTPNYMVIDSSGNVGINQSSSIAAKLHVNGNIRWGGSNVAPYVYSAIDATGLYIENVGSTAANSAIRLQCRNTNSGSYSSIKIDPSSSTITANVAGTNRLILDTTSYIYHNTGSTTFNANGYIYTQSWINLGGGAGIYSSTNGAHFYPGGTSYGTWRIDGSRGGYTGIYLSHGATNIGMFDSGGNGGTWSATAGWHYYYVPGNTCLGIGSSTTSSTYGLYVTGAIYSTGDIVAYSDRRSKENIVTIDNALDKVSKIRGVYYTPKEGDDKSRKVGVIAQELNEILPEAVTYAEDVDQYGVDYGKITGLLIEAVKELQAKVKELENK